MRLPLKMQRARRQTEFNSSTARASLLLIIVRSARRHRCSFHSMYSYIYMCAEKK